MPDDAELKRLAEASCPASWSAKNDGEGIGWSVTDINDDTITQHACEDDAAFIAAANPATVLRLLRERDEARAKLASAQHDVEVYRDAVIEAREVAYERGWSDLLAIFEDLHGLPGAGEGA